MNARGDEMRRRVSLMSADPVAYFAWIRAEERRRLNYQHGVPRFLRRWIKPPKPRPCPIELPH